MEWIRHHRYRDNLFLEIPSLFFKLYFSRTCTNVLYWNKLLKWHYSQWTHNLWRNFLSWFKRSMYKMSLFDTPVMKRLIFQVTFVHIIMPVIRKISRSYYPIPMLKFLIRKVNINKYCFHFQTSTNRDLNS